MKKEHSKRFHYPTISKRELALIIRNTLIFAAVAYLFLAPTTINRQTTADIYSGLRDGVTECSFNETYDAIATFGAGGYKTDDGNDAPSTFSRGRLEATAKLVKNGTSDRVILLDGYQGKTADLSTNKNYLKKHVPQLPDENIIVDSESTSTATNVDSAKETIEKKGLGKVAFVTDEFHKIRAGIILKIKKVDGCIFTVEKVGQHLNQENMKTIKQQNHNRGSWWRNISEKLKTVALLYDPQGVFTARAERFFAQLVNK